MGSAVKNQLRDPRTGKFKRIIRIWDDSSWDEGYFDNRGRFRVYRPDYPKSMKGGYAFRAHVVWWLAHSICPDEGIDIHHRNGDITDDGLENLESMVHGEHSKLHNPGGREMAILFCPHCQQEFKIPTWRIRCRWKAGSKTRYCSQDCYHAVPHTKQHKHNISEGNIRAWARGRRDGQRRMT